MLVLSRKVGEEIIIGSNVRMKVLAIHGNQVRLGCVAPPDIPIYRSELTTKAPSTVPTVGACAASLPLSPDLT